LFLKHTNIPKQNSNTSKNPKKHQKRAAKHKKPPTNLNKNPKENKTNKKSTPIKIQRHRTTQKNLNILTQTLKYRIHSRHYTPNETIN
jgi:hypothetical protein